MKQYSTLYAYRDLDGLEKALSALHSVLRSFADATSVSPTLIPYGQKDGDPMAQTGYIGVIFCSAVGPIVEITVRDHDKQSFAYEKYVQIGEA